MPLMLYIANLTARRAPIAARRALVCHLSSSKQPDDRPQEWRKQQLDRLENKLSDVSEDVSEIVSDDALQPMWKDMENRVKRRRPRTVQENGGKSGRANVSRRTDEDAWLEGGLYDQKEQH